MLGSAGTGKTTVSSWAARHHLEKDPTGHSRVLFLTFSRTAVSQIISRSAGVTRGLEDRLEVATFHGLAYRLIRAFGRYVGFGTGVPEVQSAARQRLLGVEPDRLAYDDLVPAALRIVESPIVGDLVRSRWSMIICDEFQDTSDAQWRLLVWLAEGKRLLLFADENQMIYTWVDGVGIHRLAQARLFADEIIELEPPSHRDPSGCIPAMATAVRRREWNHDAIRSAVFSGRLRVIAGVDEDDHLVEMLWVELRRMRRAGCRSVGIFGHSNAGVAELGSVLHKAGIPHALIGIPEAQGEAIATMGICLLVGYRAASKKELRQAYATFLTACWRGKTPPPIATAIVKDHPTHPVLHERFSRHEQTLQEAAEEGFERVINVACEMWERIGVQLGERAWYRASVSFTTTAIRMASLDLTALRSAIERMRLEALIGYEETATTPVRLMNFHQTKGREADGIALIYRDGDTLADHHDTEPFIDPSRVLYVSLTRARSRLLVVLPSNPHPLVAPFARFAF